MKAVLAVVLLAGYGASPAQGDPPDWRVNPAAYEATMSVTGVSASSEQRSAGVGDLLAAFVHEAGVDRIRGVAEATEVGGQYLFFLTIHANTDGETVRLKHYDHSAGVVYLSVETLSFQSNGIIGTVSDPVVWTDGELDALRPGWMIDEAAFAVSMTVAASVTIDGNGSETKDQLAAFVGTRIRGVAHGMEVSGRVVFFLTVHAQTSGEEVFFQFFDSSSDSILQIDETVVFAANAVLGSPAMPVAFRATSVVSATAIHEFGTEDPVRPAGFEVSVPYPNPTSGATTVEVTMPAGGLVRARLVDVLGRVRKVYDTQDLAAGPVRLEYDLSDATTGFYLLILDSGSRRIARSLLVARTP